MIELTPLDRDEWMPRVRVYVLTAVSEAREAIEELTRLERLQISIQSLYLVAEKDPHAEWPEGYIVRSMWEPCDIIGWADAVTRPERAAELSWETAVKFRGHGYMREAAPRIAEWLLRRRGMNVVTALIPGGDTSSEKVALACGLSPTGQSSPTTGMRMWTRTAT